MNKQTNNNIIKPQPEAFCNICSDVFLGTRKVCEKCLDEKRPKVSMSMLTLFWALPFILTAIWALLLYAFPDVYSAKVKDPKKELDTFGKLFKTIFSEGYNVIATTSGLFPVTYLVYVMAKQNDWDVRNLY